MPRHHMTVDGPVPFTQAEEDAQDAKDAAELAAKPLRQWNRDMRISDSTLPRWGEDLYDGLNPADQANVSQEAKDLVAAKKALRATKP